MARKPIAPETEAPTEERAPDAVAAPPPPVAAADADADADAETMPAAGAPTIVVTGPKEGRRRAGRQFGAEPVSIQLEDLSTDELEALIGDPALTTRVVDAPY